MRHFFELWKGKRTWDAEDEGEVAADDAEDAAEAKEAKESKAPDYVMSKSNRALVERRLAALQMPPGLVSGTVRKVFAHTGACCLAFAFARCCASHEFDAFCCLLFPLFAGFVKAHDWLVFCTMLGLFVMRGTLPDHYLHVFFRFCDVMARLTTCVVHEADYAQLETDIIELLCLLELHYPATELTIAFHLLLHAVLYQQLWGPVPRWWMFAVERMLGFLTRKIKSRSKPEENLLNSFVLFREAQHNRPKIEQALRSSARFEEYSKLLDSNQKLSASGPLASARSFGLHATPEGRASKLQLTDSELVGVEKALRLAVPQYGSLLEEKERALNTAARRVGGPGRPRKHPLPASAAAAGSAAAAAEAKAWPPSGRTLSNAEQDLLLGPLRGAVRYPRAVLGGVTFRGANGQAGSAATR